MKVLVINDLFAYGGAEAHCREEVELLRREGHDARLLTVEPVEVRSRSAGGQRGPHSWAGCLDVEISTLSEGWQRFVPRQRYVGMVRAAVNQFCPDVVHVHNVNLLGRSLLAALPRHRTVQTVHDYSFICPRGTGINHRDQECVGYASECCVKSSHLSVSEMVKAAALPVMQKDRDRVGVKYVCPSEDLASKVRRLGVDVRVIRNPYMGTTVSLSHRQRGRFVYVGLVNRSKGIDLLLDAWEILSRNGRGFRLTIAGRVETGYGDHFRQRLAEVGDTVEYVGEQSRSQVLDLYDTAFCSIVPSVWMENYPTTIIEAQARACLVIGANRGGIPEMLLDPRQTFDVVSGAGSLVEVLEQWDAVPEGEYVKTVRNGVTRVQEENAPDRYVGDLLKVFDSCVRQS